MKKILALCLGGLVLWLCHSCSSYPTHIPEQVRQVLKLAGENDSELLKVIDHYHSCGELQKLQAAYFLIGNMKDKYSERYAYGESFAHAVKEDRKNYEFKDLRKSGYIDRYRQILDARKRMDGADPVREFDAENITAEFLIKNIDLAFQIWQEPWSRHFNFEQFCEYILPYRIYNEKLTDWREELLNRYYHVKDSVENVRDTEEIALYLNDLIGSQYLKNFDGLPLLDPITLDDLKLGECQDRYLLIASVFRAMGIPTMIDYTPQKSYSFKSHEWTVYLDTLSRYRPFDGGDARRFLFQKMPPSGSRPAGMTIPLDDGFGPTVYRRMYSRQQGNLSDRVDKQAVPPLFRSPFRRNVTAEYEFPIKSDVVVDIGEYGIHRKETVYLGVFGYGEELREADWSTILEGKVSFGHLGENLIYVLCTYSGNNLQPFSYPFIILEGEIVHFRPDITKPRDLVLTRKCKISAQMKEFAENMVGGFFEGANDPRFIDAELLYTIDTAPEFLVERQLSASRPYRYVRYVSPEKDINLAELHFISEDTNGKKEFLQGEVIHSAMEEGENPTLLFDNNIQTNYNAPAGSWVGLDLGRPMNINTLEYLPRNNFNVIVQGDTYELFYYDRKWISLGQQIAEDQYLRYAGVPENALLLLKNRTQGKEERIFTYENDKQLWW